MVQNYRSSSTDDRDPKEIRVIMKQRFQEYKDDLGAQSHLVNASHEIRPYFFISKFTNASSSCKKFDSN